MWVTLDVVGEDRHEFDVDDESYADLLRDVGLNPHAVAVLVDGRPVPEVAPATRGDARVIRVVSGG